MVPGQSRMKCLNLSSQERTAQLIPLPIGGLDASFSDNPPHLILDRPPVSILERVLQVPQSCNTTRAVLRAIFEDERLEGVPRPVSQRFQILPKKSLCLSLDISAR